MKPFMYRRLILLVAVAVSVTATPARTFPAASTDPVTDTTPASTTTVDVDKASTSFVHWQPGAAHCTFSSPSRVLDIALSSPSATLAAPTSFLTPELEDITGKATDSSFDEQSSGTFPDTASSPGPVPVEFMRMGNIAVAPRVIFGIIFAFALFVALHLALLFLGYRCCCSRRRVVHPHPPPRISVAVYPTPHPYRSSTQTVASGSSDAGDDRKDDVSVRDSGVARVEMLPITRPKPARHHSRPRVPLMESVY
ncbi:hypothetical protein DFH07DRAFT_766504 [Mycena maculata]|uniref:Uncharacterized protein n=1 Tax=Mycena maculata TaxID=230809 RepID=A0AAD7K2D2_9AGAR|nr:hypothetical protein DFH07DRAFT_766504 [Mycena maculata]